MSPVSKKKDYLADLFGNPLRARVVQALVRAGEIGTTLVLIARSAHATPKKAKLELVALLKSKIVTQGGKKGNETWKLNQFHPLHSSLMQFVGSAAPARHDSVAAQLKKVGRISTIVLSGMFVGDSGRPVDLLVIGDNVSEAKLEREVKRLEEEWGQEIRYTLIPITELRYRLTVHDRLLREVIDFPHRVVLDTKGLLT